MNCTPKTVSKYVSELTEKEYLIIGKIRQIGRGGDQDLNKYMTNIPTKVLSSGNHLITKVLSDRNKGTSLHAPKVLPHGKHNNNTNNNKNNNVPFSSKSEDQKQKKPANESFTDMVDRVSGEKGITAKPGEDYKDFWYRVKTAV